MKSLPFFLLLPLLLCASLALMSCGSERELGIEYTQVNQSLSGRTEHFNYEDHAYILFSFSRSSNGIVHDPDCPCHLKEL